MLRLLFGRVAWSRLTIVHTVILDICAVDCSIVTVGGSWNAGIRTVADIFVSPRRPRSGTAVETVVGGVHDSELETDSMEAKRRADLIIHPIVSIM